MAGLPFGEVLGFSKERLGAQDPVVVTYPPVNSTDIAMEKPTMQ